MAALNQADAVRRFQLQGLLNKLRHPRPGGIDQRLSLNLIGALGIFQLNQPNARLPSGRKAARPRDNLRAQFPRLHGIQHNQPRIILSRTANQFLERLFEQEVPEIFDGLITLKKIVRIPGERAKVAVESYDERIDPVGACVGMKGSRIYSIVKELRNENIDVVNYTANPSLMIQRALNPAKISSITIDEEKKTASVYLKPDQVSLAIGKGGLNIRLSKMLTGYDIDVYREIEEEDVALTEFADEIDGWVIDALKACGCDTAKSVLELPVEEIAARADLELEQAQKVVEILKAEFEE